MKNSHFLQPRYDEVEHLSIERTFDAKLVQSIISDEELHKRAGLRVEVSMYDPENQKDIYYLIPRRNSWVLGVIVFDLFNHPICYQGHVNYIPEKWGSGLAKYTKAAIQWMFDNTDCLKVIALATDTYPEVLKQTKKAGLKVEGYLEKSIITNDILVNQTIMGIEK